MVERAKHCRFLIHFWITKPILMLLCHFGISAVIILYSGCNHLLHAKNGDYYFPSCNAIKYCWKLWSFFITFFYFLCCCLELWSEMNLQSGDGKKYFWGPFTAEQFYHFHMKKCTFCRNLISILEMLFIDSTAGTTNHQ